MSELSRTIALGDSRLKINGALKGARNKTMLQLLGNPRGSYSQECQPPTNRKVIDLIDRSRNVGPFRVTGLRPAVDTLEVILAEVKEKEPEIHATLGHMGMLCCRFVRNSASAISNHSWGTAIDLTIDGILDQRGDGRAQKGLIEIHEIFNKHGFFWGIAFPTEDAMHFEASEQLLRQWHQEGKFGDEPAPPHDENLDFGDRSTEVAELQRLLSKALGTDITPDGVFGAQTRAAVIEFQSRNKLAPDGVAGSMTMEALRKVAPAATDDNLKFGDESAEVAELQRLLSKALGIDITPDGVFGSQTRVAVVEFQTRNSLAQDGVAGKKTMEALRKPVATPPTVTRTRSKGTSSPATDTSRPIDQITRIAAESDIAHHKWKVRGVAPAGYIKGMALVYARVYCKLKAGEPTATEMAKANTHDEAKDALAFYNDIFTSKGMRNDVSGPDTLRHLFVLLIGLGMRESSGRHCEGRDLSASNTTAERAEAGLFQTSFNARTAHTLLPKLFTQYLERPSGFLEVFREGVVCSPRDLQNFGSGAGGDFQRLSKECPAFAAEFAALGLRNIRDHWGPINRKKAEVLGECDAMLRRIQSVVDTSPNVCSELVIH
jgi:peptidoglycan hydrolase-like protein with peptidoglycan-binding domain